MKNLQGEHLKLSFYFANLKEVNLFPQIVSTLLSLGAKFSGIGYAHHGKGIRDSRFAGIDDELLEPILVPDMATLEEFFADPDLRPVQVFMQNATGTMEDVSEIVTYTSISTEALTTDQHPLAIWSEGYLFSGTFRETHAAQMREKGYQAYQRFCALVERLTPTYAAITIEEPLLCPTDLRLDSRSYAFRNFFVSVKSLNSSLLKRIKGLFSGAYIADIGDGIYISSSEEFNPDGNNLDVKYSAKQSIEVAKLIANEIK